MKLHLIIAASAALLCAAPIGSVEAQVAQAIESQREETFLEQASDYLFEAENAQVFADKEKDNNKKRNDKEKNEREPLRKKRNDKGKDEREPLRKKRNDKGKDEREPYKKPKKTPEPTKKPKKTPEPTRKPRRNRKPTPRPTKRYTISRRQANRLIARDWRTDECAMRPRRQSARCRGLNDGVCSMSERRIIRRFNEKAVDVCTKVGLPPDTEDYDNVYTEDEDYDSMYEYDFVDSEFDSEPIYEDEDYDYDYQE